MKNVLQVCYCENVSYGMTVEMNDNETKLFVILKLAERKKTFLGYFYI